MWSSSSSGAWAPSAPRQFALLVLLMQLMLPLLTACGDPAPREETPVQEPGCLGCHGGIEKAHPAMAKDACAVCHGGDEAANTKEAAHIPVPKNWAEVRGTGLPEAPHGFIRDMPPNMLDALDPAYVRFINPGDIRVLDGTCGRSDCHEDKARSMPNSVMTTNVGHYLPTRAYAGMQERNAVYGSHPAIDPDHDGQVGTVASVKVLVPPGDAEFKAALKRDDPEELEALAYDHYLAKNCNTCHAAGYPRNNARAAYRSTGCTACHMVYNMDGVYEGGDPSIPKGSPVHPARHELTTAIPTEQCATCHFQGGRIGLLFRGIREGGFSKDKTPPHATPWEESVYGHAAGYYFLDEDDRNNVDETPPDVHYSAGLHCSDCHVGSDVHGDGNLYETAKYQVDIRCEDCHGTAREAATPAKGGAFRTARGRKLPQLKMKKGEVVLTARVSGREHVVPQPAKALADGSASPSMHAAMAPDVDGWSHTDSLTCDSCHSSVQQQCLGCHVSVDSRLSQTDYQSGESTLGFTRGAREHWSIDGLLLAKGVDGRAQPTNSSAQVQMSVVDRDGNLRVGVEETDGTGEPTGKFIGKFRSNDQIENVVGFAPFFQHTTSKGSRACNTCHRGVDTPAETERVRGVYGYGTGEFMLPNAHGPDVDALRFIDDSGKQVGDFIHMGTGPLPPEVIERALSVVLSEPK